MYFTKVLIRAAALSVIAAAGLGYLSHCENTRAHALAERGIPATATIEGIRWKNVGAAREDFKLDMVFDTRDGSASHVTVPLDEERGRRISAGSAHGKLDVRYLPEDAEVVQVAGMALQTSAGRYLLMACLATLLAVVFAWGGFKRGRRRRAASRLPR